jgi:hypothetical protein
MRAILRILIILAFATILASPCMAVKRITVKQLNQILIDARSMPDEVVARSLSGLELTQRLSIQNLSRIRPTLPGPQSLRALAAVADASAFLNLPAEEIPRDAPLDKDGQQKLLTLASDYVEKTLAKLPNFFATEAITLFEDTPAGVENGLPVSYQPMHYESKTNANVYYRAGKEVMESRAGEITENEQLVSAGSGLLSSGEFGPVLKTVLTDSQKGKLTWSHWELSIDPNSAAAPPIAVFRYAVPRKESHYKIKVELSGASKPSQSRPGYHGEIAIDPSSGTILRLTLLADTTDDDSLSAADMMVEYGSVDIGGKSYICPLRSVAIVKATLEALMYSPGAAAIIGSSNKGGGAANLDIPHKDQNNQTLLNDVTFEHYHLLRSDAKILTPADLNDDGPNP